MKNSMPRVGTHNMFTGSHTPPASAPAQTFRAGSLPRSSVRSMGSSLVKAVASAVSLPVKAAAKVVSAANQEAGHHLQAFCEKKFAGLQVSGPSFSR